MTKKTTAEFHITSGSAKVEVAINYGKKTADITPPYLTRGENHGGKFSFSGNSFDLWSDVASAITEAVNFIKVELDKEATQ